MITHGMISWYVGYIGHTPVRAAIFREILYLIKEREVFKEYGYITIDQLSIYTGFTRQRITCAINYLEFKKIIEVKKSHSISNGYRLTNAIFDLYTTKNRSE